MNEQLIISIVIFGVMLAPAVVAYWKTRDFADTALVFIFTLFAFVIFAMIFTLVGGFLYPEGL